MVDIIQDVAIILVACTTLVLSLRLRSLRRTIEALMEVDYEQNRILDAHNEALENLVDLQRRRHGTHDGAESCPERIPPIHGMDSTRGEVE